MKTKQSKTQSTKTKSKKQEPFICLSALKSRGWTDGIIKLFKLKPDRTVRNSQFYGGRDVKLYLLKNIERLEKTEKFQDARKKLEKRLFGAKWAQESLYEDTIKAIYSCVDDTEIKFPYEGWHDLFDILNEAIYHYNDDKKNGYHSFYSDEYCQPIDEEDEDIEDISTDWTRQYSNPTDEDIECLRRVVLKYLRRYCTDYDWRFGYILTHFSSSWTQYALKALKAHIEEEAIKKYPELEVDKFGDWLIEQCRRHKGCLASEPRICVRIHI